MWCRVIFVAALVGCAVPVEGVEQQLPQIGSSAEAARICAMDKTVHGIDVSYWQGPSIDWDTVATTSAKYVFIRASYGLSTTDDYFARNWKGAERVGLLRGAYHFFLPDLDPVAQADKFLSIMGPLKPGDLPPVLDVEDARGVSPKAFQTAIRKWINRVREKTGVMPIIYTRFYFWKDQLENSDEWVDAPMWTAHYTNECPLSPDPWPKWDFWQYSDTGRTAGISGNVDQNLFNGTLADLKQLTVGAQQCPSIPADGRIVDEDDACFLPTGPLEYWRSASGGHNGSLLWTYTTDKDNVVNGCEWSLNFETAGRYSLSAYTSDPLSQATMAKYRIETADGAKSAVVDQTKVDGWNPIGVYAFETGRTYRISVGDNTGTPTDQEVKLTCDALRISPDDGIDESSQAGEDTEEPSSPPTNSPGDEDNGTADEPSVGQPAADPMAGAGGQLTGTCSVSERAPTVLWPLALLALLARFSRPRGASRARDQA